MSNYSRRAFLEQVAVMGGMAASAGSWTAALAADAPKPADLKLGFVTYLWGQDWDLPTLLANLAKTRVLGVELRVQHKHGVEPTLSTDERKAVKQRFADSPVKLLGMGTNEAYDYLDADKLKRSIENTKAFVKLSHDCGGSGVKVKPNDLHEKEGVPREKTIRQIGEALNEVGRFAADLGQQIRLEVHGSASPLPVIRAIMDVADNKNVTVCWNSNPEDLQPPGLEHNFNLVKDRFGDTCHVRELNVGSYPYQELMRLFVKNNYRGWILLECRTNPPDRIKALDEQREVFEKMLAKSRA